MTDPEQLTVNDPRNSDARGPLTVIDAHREWALPNLREIWTFRELLWTLTLRDIRVRYKQTAIGIAWAVLQPFMTMVVFTVIFGGLAKLPSDGKPYAVFTMAAILPWQFFARALTQGSMSLVSMGGMLSKVYFPRLLAPLSSILAGLIDLAIAFVILVALLLWYGIMPGWAVLTLPFFILLAILTALGVSLWLSAINVHFRDVQHTLPFLAQIWMFVTPVVYSRSLVPEEWQMLYMLNPMAGVVEGFRWALLGGQAPPDPAQMAVSIVVILVMVVSGLFYFDRAEKNFVDRL